MKRIISAILLLSILFVSNVAYAGGTEKKVNFNGEEYWLDGHFYQYSSLYSIENGGNYFNGSYEDIINASLSFSLEFLFDPKYGKVPDVVLFPNKVEFYYGKPKEPVASVEGVKFYEHLSNVKTIIIEDGIRAVLNCNFFDFPNLTTVIIPESVRNIELSTTPFISKIPSAFEVLNLPVDKFWIWHTDEDGGVVGTVAPEYAEYEDLYFQTAREIDEKRKIEQQEFEKEYQEKINQVIFYAKEGSYVEQYLKKEGFNVKPYVSVNYNGEEIFSDQPATLISGRTLIPLRACLEALGATVEWDESTSTVTSKKGNTKISLAIDSNQLYVNGAAKTIDVPAQLINDRTMVPARAIAEAFGCKVDWVDATKTVIIEE